MSGATNKSAGMLRKDQRRAVRAYDWAAAAKAGGYAEDYKIAVQSFAAALLQSGLAVAVSVLERSQERKAFKLLMQNLAAYSDVTPDTKWPEKMRELPVRAYMQVTREYIALLAWLSRACRALEDRP